MNMNNGFIEVKNLTKIIEQRTILENINLTVDRKTIVGFIGINGSGKTMLLRSIAGLIKPSEGCIRVNGQLLGADISFPPSMGLMIENIGLWDYMTGYECLKTLAEIKGKISDREIHETIIRVGLDPVDKRTFKKYSLGMKQRLVIAQAIMEEPELLILDEPTRALDSEGVKLIHHVLLSEKERGATILLASHSSDDIATLCDITYKINEGRIMEA
jgi:ABC-2 type transport system ATP-binding protein